MWPTNQKNSLPSWEGVSKRIHSFVHLLINFLTTHSLSALGMARKKGQFFSRCCSKWSDYPSLRLWPCLINYESQIAKETTSNTSGVSVPGSSDRIKLGYLGSFKVRKAQSLINLFLWSKDLYLPHMRILATVLVLQDNYLYVYCGNIVLLTVVE